MSCCGMCQVAAGGGGQSWSSEERCVLVVFLLLGQGQRLCHGRSVGQSAVCEDVGALAVELEDDAPFRLLLRGPLLGFSLWPVEGDVAAPSRAVVGEEAEDGVLFQVVYVLHVCCHVGDTDSVLLPSFLGVPRGAVAVYPLSPCRVTSDRSPSRDARYVVGPLLPSQVGWWRRRALERFSQGACCRGRGCGRALCGEPARLGSAGPFEWALVLAGFGPRAARFPPCVGAPEPVGCRSPGPYGHRGWLCVGMLPCGVAGAPCRCSGCVWRPLWDGVLVLGGGCGSAWLR